MRSKRAWLSVFGVGMATGWIAAAVISFPAVQADDEDKARLYVNCAKNQVQPIVDFVVERGGTVHDMDSFHLLLATKKAHPVPPLQSSTAVVQAVYEALATVDKSEGTFWIQKMTVTNNRFSLSIIVAEHKTTDAIRAALDANGHLGQRMGRGGRIEVLGTKRLGSGLIRQDFTGRLKEPVGEHRVPEFADDSSISTTVMDQLAVKTGMRTLGAGAERWDPNRQKGVTTVYREFTYGPAELTRLRALLIAIEQHPDLTVIDVRFSIDENKSTPQQPFIEKSRIKVARYAPLK